MPEPSTVAPAVARARREPRILKSTHGLAFCSPPALLFVVLVIALTVSTLYMGTDTGIYPAIFSGPIFVQSFWNTIIFVGLVVNIKTFFLSRARHITLPAVMKNFLATDNPPWSFLMAESALDSIPPVIPHYSFRLHLPGGLATGAVAGNLASRRNLRGH